MSGIKFQKSLDEQRKEKREEIEKIKGNLEDLELTLKERWAEVKDFSPGNSWEKMESLKRWHKYGYKKDYASLNRKLTKAINELENL